MRIIMARGDIFSFGFGLYIDTVLTGETMDEIYFTVKKHHYDEDYLFQKRLTAGTITNDGNGNYSITIDAEDTDNLSIGTYDFDIEVVKLPNIKRTFVGVLELTKEVTYARNEVS